MKKNMFMCLMFAAIFFSACSSTPDFVGMWSAENWEGKYIEFASNYKYYIYMDEEKKESRDFFDMGWVTYTEMDGIDCLKLQSDILMEKGTSQGYHQFFAYEMINDSQVLLYTDMDYQNEKCLDNNANADLVTITLDRIN